MTFFGPNDAAALRKRTALAALTMLFLMPWLAPAALCADEETYHWKSVDGAQVKLDDKVPVTWNIYQLEKKKQPNLVLVLMGRRYILLDSKAKLAYLVFPADLHAQGNDFNSEDLAQQSHLIPSVDWTERDIGPAEEIRLTMEDYGRNLSVQLPHPLNLRLGIY